jgi:putative papain-like cysteine peptidase DUF1796
MKKTYLIFFFIYCTNFLSAYQQSDEIINLGGDCQPAYQLHIHGLRKYALPFDKLITPFDALQKLLENKFEGFLDPDNFELVITDKEKYIRDKKYNTRFIHDFKLDEDFLKNYEIIRETYQRRIDRLLNKIKEAHNPLFIRKKINKDQAVALKILLDKMRDGKPYTLVALDGTEEMKTNWHIDGIINCFLRQPTPYTWKGDNEAWKEIFISLGLCPASAAESTSEI